MPRYVSSGWIYHIKLCSRAPVRAQTTEHNLTIIYNTYNCDTIGLLVLVFLRQNMNSRFLIFLIITIHRRRFIHKTIIIIQYKLKDFLLYIT
jgi:hypothetical protein